MADIPRRVRMRDRFKQKLGLQWSPIVGASNVGKMIPDSSNSTASDDAASTAVPSPGQTSSNPLICVDPGAVTSIIGPPDNPGPGTSSSTRKEAEEAADPLSSTGNVHSPALATTEPMGGIESSSVTVLLSEGTPLPRDLWREALDKLSLKDQQNIKQLQPGEGTEKPMPDTIRELIDLTTTLRDKCQERRFKFRFRGHDIILRDVARKITFWLSKFKEIGDVAVNFDPVHASLPWAGVRFLLQTAVGEHEQMGDLLVATEKVSYLINRGAIYERLFRHETVPEDVISNFHHALIRLYASTLRMISLCHRLFIKNTAKRTVHAIFNPDDVSAHLEECEKLEVQIEFEVQNCERARSQEADESSKRLLEILQAPALRTDQNVLGLLEKVGEKERLEVLDWISNALYGLNHKTVKEKRTTDTCGWLLDHSQYREWRETSSSIILWLCGTAGTGKTFLTSKVVDEIQLTLISGVNQEAFAFFYCNRNEELRREPLSVLRGFIRQLSTITSEEHSIQKRLQNFHSECRLKASEPTMNDCKELLLELIDIYPRTTLVLDALDECEKDKRLELIEILDHLLAEASNPVKIFISSRPDGDIKERLKDRANIAIDAPKNQGDISRFVNSEIIKHRRWGRMGPELQIQIVETLQQQSQGMFQWAFLQLKQILALQLPREILDRLGKLPKDLKLAYDEIYNKMEGHEQKIADRAFRWVMCACTPLTTRELLPAVYQDEYSDTLLPLNGLDEDLLLEYCHNLLIIDPVRQVWIPSHLSVIEYFENHLWNQCQANCLVSSVCLVVLNTTVLYEREKHWQGSESTFDDEPSITEKSGTEGNSITEETPEPGDHLTTEDNSSPEEDGTLQLDPDTTTDRPISVKSMETCDPLDSQEFEGLSFYARHHWPIHAKQSAGKGNGPRCLTLLDEFLGQPTNSSPAYRCWQRMVSKDLKPYKAHHTSCMGSANAEPEDLLPNAVSSFAFCAFNLAILLPDWYGFDWAKLNRKNKNWRTCLELAVHSGAAQTTRELIKHGADVNMQTESYDGSALAAASHRGELEIVKLLVKEGGADVNMQLESGIYGSALASAFYWGWQKTVEFLVKEGGADVNMQLKSEGYGSALAAASYGGERKVVEFLVKEGGADVNMQLKSGEYGSALAAASYRGERKVVEFLVKEGGADVNMQLEDGGYGSALAATAATLPSLYKKQTSILDMIERLVVEWGADVNMRLQYGKYANALDAAKAKGNAENAQLLIKLGAREEAAHTRLEGDIGEETAKEVAKVVIVDETAAYT